MKTNFIVKPEAEGTHNGKAYRGLVVATMGKEKAIAFSYLPDVFDEDFGKSLAELKLKQKLLRRRQVKLNEVTSLHEFELDYTLGMLSKLHLKNIKYSEQKREIQQKIDALLK